jgi:hypothetical protein
MPLHFYPQVDDITGGTLEDRTETLMEAAERFKAIVLDEANKVDVKRSIPREQTAAYNWEEIARVLREVRDLPEASKTDKIRKANLLKKLSDVYEVLRGAKMSKLEAVRIALVSEAAQLSG